MVVPTHGRAGRVLALRPFPEATLCVARSQEAAYREHYPDADYLIHPDEVKGLAPKRQWIYEILGDVFMVDDDVEAFRTRTVEKGQTPLLDPPVPHLIVDRTAETARQLGAFLFGFTQFGDPATYRPQRPLRLSGHIGGHAMGLLAGSKLYWHPDAGSVEDFWICLLNAYYHRIAVIDDRYWAAQLRTFKGAGGLANQRVSSTFKEEYEFLRAHFGEAVRMKRDYSVRGATGQRRQRFEQEPWHPTMSLPF